MASRSKLTQNAFDRINFILSLETVTITTEEQKIHSLPSSDPRAQLFKQGLCDALQIILHESKSYNGFSYLDPSDKNREFDRKYY
jgi:hypothetical protein